KALEFYQKRLALSEALGDKPGIAVTLDMIGVTHYTQGNYAQALEYCQKSLALAEEMGDRARVTNTLIGLANASRLQGNYTQALDFANRAMVLAKQFDYFQMFWRAKTIAGRSYRDLNQLTAARQAFGEAIATIETSRAQVVGGETDLSRYFSDK